VLPAGAGETAGWDCFELTGVSVSGQERRLRGAVVLGSGLLAAAGTLSEGGRVSRTTTRVGRSARGTGLAISGRVVLGVAIVRHTAAVPPAARQASATLAAPPAPSATAPAVTGSAAPDGATLSAT
jgi:hypothetical protein